MSDLNLEGLNDSQKRIFAVRCARRVQHLMTDPRSIEALDVAERYALGQATDAELKEARAAAYAASASAGDAEYAARAAAGSTSAAESDAAWDAAWDAVYAARAAASVARGSAWAAWAVERDAQVRILEEIRGMTR